MQDRALASRAQQGVNRRTVLEWLTFVTAMQIALLLVTVVPALVAAMMTLRNGGRTATARSSGTAAEIGVG